MAFLQKDIYKSDAYEVSANHGETHIVPAELINRPGLHVNRTGLTIDDLRDYIDGTIDTDDDDNPIVEYRAGVYLARMSAPGYMDCTDWTIHDTREEAEAYLAEMYGDDDEEGR